MAQEHPHRCGTRRCKSQRQPPCGEVCPHKGKTWSEESRRGGRALDPCDLLPHSAARRSLPGDWRGPLSPMSLGGGLQEATGPSAGETGAQGYARTATSACIGGPYSTGFSHQASDEGIEGQGELSNSEGRAVV